MKTCKNCRFWELIHKTDSEIIQSGGECRRNAPVNVTPLQHMGNISISLQERMAVETNEEYWCGEWRNNVN